MCDTHFFTLLKDIPYTQSTYLSSGVGEYEKVTSALFVCFLSQDWKPFSCVHNATHVLDNLDALIQVMAGNKNVVILKEQ